MIIKHNIFERNVWEFEATVLSISDCNYAHPEMGLTRSGNYLEDMLDMN
jgi:hypothetical protein